MSRFLVTLFVVMLLTIACNTKQGITQVDKLVGNKLAEAEQLYTMVKRLPKYEINLDERQYELHGAIISHRDSLKTSIVEVHTWEDKSNKIVVWVGETYSSGKVIIDAIKYDKEIQY